MPLDMLRFSITLDFDFNYHQLSLKEGDKVKTTFWNINFHQEDFFKWKFLSFCFLNAPTKYYRVMD
jgi:hypothetical protein